MQNDGNSTRRRHVPVKNASHIYWSETKTGKVFEVRHPLGADGRRLYEVVGPRLDQAKARAREVYGEGAPRIASVGMTISQIATDWQRARQMRPGSVATYDGIYRAHIEPKLGRVRARDLDRPKIQAWLNGLKREDGRPGNLASGTRALILSTLSMILSHAVEMGAITAVPTLAKHRKPKPSPARRRILTQEEERDLLAQAEDWLRPIIVVTLHQALRLGEAAALQWEDVDFAAGTITVRHTLGMKKVLGPPKGGTQETIPLTPVARRTLLDLRAGCDGTGFVFGSRTLRNIQYMFCKARDRAALTDGVMFHSLRHTGISRLANHPAIPLVHVREFARHKDLVVTQGYVHKIDSEAVTTAIGEALAAGGVA